MSVTPSKGKDYNRLLDGERGFGWNCLDVGILMVDVFVFFLGGGGGRRMVIYVGRFWLESPGCGGGAFFSMRLDLSL